MSSQRLARQAHTKRWKRVRREVEKVRAAVRAEIRAEQDARDAARAEQAVQEAARLHPHQEQLHMPRVINCNEPNRSWAEHPLKEVWYTTDRKCLRPMDSSSVETEDDATAHQSRQRRRPRRYSNSSSDDDSTPTARKQPRTVGMPGSPVQEISLPTPPPYGSMPLRHVASPTPHTPVFQPASRLGLEGSFTQLDTSLNPVRARTHDGEEGASVVATMERIIEAHVGRLMRRMDARMDALEAKVEALISRTHSPQPPLLQEDLLSAPCRTVDELEELDRSLAQQDRRNKMQHFLGTLGGGSAGDAIRRILRRVATNDVLAQYSLKGRGAKKSFEELALCKIITAACVKNFPGQTEAKVEECIGQALKFAPHRRSAGQQE